MERLNDKTPDLNKDEEIKADEMKPKSFMRRVKEFLGEVFKDIDAGGPPNVLIRWP